MGEDEAAAIANAMDVLRAISAASRLLSDAFEVLERDMIEIASLAGGTDADRST
jgi:hypothetical protein